MQPYVATIPLAPVELFLLVATRLLAALATSPVINSRNVPGTARIGLGLFTALVMLPIVTRQHPAALPVTLDWTTIASEALTGALAGFSASLVYSAIQFGAGLINVQAGFGLGAVYDPAMGESNSTLERFYGALAALLFLQLNGHHLLLSALRELFLVVPLGSFGPDSLKPGALVQIATGMLRVAVQLVLPVLGALLLVDVALAILARAAPQFNLFAVGVSAKVGLALAAILAVLPVTAVHMQGIFEAVARTAVGVMR